jgi:hypothetical protein
VGIVENVDGLAGILDCRVSSLPLKYLGLSLGASFKANSIWDRIIEKIDHRLASWKMRYLSKGVEIIGVLASFGVYERKEIIGVLRTWRGYGGYLSFDLSYFVSLDCGFCVLIVS